MQVRIWGVGLAGLLTAACSGQLILPESYGRVGSVCTTSADCADGLVCDGSACVDASRCSAGQPEGACPAGLECREGSCVPEGYCQCALNQGCLGGTCVDVTVGSCSPAQPLGLCAAGEVCVGGSCVPIDDGNRCSLDRRYGLCPNGLVCVEGTCLPIDADPCSPTNTGGRCPAGQACSSAGVCETLPCSFEVLLGACGVDEVCRSGQCVPLPCGPGHVHGSCPDAQFCSVTGACLPDGTCAAAGDCQGDFVCSAAATCIPPQTCAIDGDCSRFFRCDGGACVRSYTCSIDGDCPSAEQCSMQGLCTPRGVCSVDADCEAGERCATVGQCIPASDCLDGRDCSSTEFCSVAGICLAVGSCSANEDCPPAQACESGACVPSGETCTANATTQGCTPGEFHCCPSGEQCCPSNSQRCSLSVGRCIAPPECLSDADCLSGSTVCGPDYTCVPVAPCGMSCDAGEKCSSVMNTCIPEDACLGDADCAVGESCSGSFTCVPSDNCGSTQFQATLVPPNMLVVLDRSGSMNYCDGDGVTRWTEAKTVISQVLTAQAGRIRFGLSTYPRQCDGAQACSPECGSEPWKHCLGTYCDADGDAVPYPPDYGDGEYPNQRPGVVEVMVADGRENTIINRLQVTYPGGGTPTGPTLRNIAASPAAFGLTSTDRANVVLLITDGEANKDFTDVTGCGPVCPANCDPLTEDDCGTCNSSGSGCCYEGDAAACKVDKAVDSLRALSPSVTTYVVGFAFSSINEYLNCHAVHGGTSLCGASVTTTNCGSASQACYYQANDAAALEAALDAIAGKIASCSYTLDQTPSDLSKLYVFLDYGGGSPPVRVDRDPLHNDAWDFDYGSGQITFYGATCDTVKNAVATPMVVYGCPDVGG